MRLTLEFVALEFGVVADRLAQFVGKGLLGVIERTCVWIADGNDESVWEGRDARICEAIHLGNDRSADCDGSQVA